MTIPNALRLASVAIAAAAVLGGPYAATALTPSDELAAHRAVYELKLAKTSGKGGAVAARGRILYDFSGNLCDGYKLEFRQVSERDLDLGQKVDGAGARRTLALLDCHGLAELALGDQGAGWPQADLA